MKISSYNAKCLIVYAIYCIYKVCVNDYDYKQEIVADLVLVPILSYIVFPFILMLLKDCRLYDWKLFKEISDTLDFIYLSIKEPTKEHSLSWMTSIKSKYHWVWLVLKIVLYFIFIIGIIFIYNELDII